MLSPTSQAVLEVLKEAYRRICVDGFLVGLQPDCEDNSAPPKRKGWTLADAMWQQEPTPERYHARLFLQAMAGAELFAWSAHPWRTKRQALALLCAAIHRLQGTLPVKHGGGWRVAGVAS